ncbi:type VII secretion-associated serine protease mycosin [[Mycobacterium] nativiensis]|uniref:Type VII secretion-associated serine protease mycosin n=1 Tax=[Mycobacterium] nativiensis TaxID=2855503 RepID=A0ABU5XV82_9MYCO|nr:type VII secretion-associated serine protease mycosin [Mycolicibacter sp. MYC340]MEB3031891.1 type VII secretion-associated serine protease mycosin [Mycolicibacter sp. MYC340]
MSGAVRGLLWRAGAVVAVSGLVMMSPVGSAVAGAVTPPVVDPDAVPADSAPGPEEPLRMNSTCMTTGLLPDTDLGAPNPSQAFMDLPALWKSAGRGAGVTVAMIDTGANPSPRLPRLHGGGDYVDPGADGLVDCDSHGTVIASIIGGAPAEGDGFAGVAPDVDLISIRQSSEAYVPANPSPGDFATQRRAGTVSTLAKAVVHAANSGARVLNMSIVACIPVLKPVDQTTLGAALRYAAVDKDMVIVAASGNLGAQDCAQNPDIDATNPHDPRNWAGVVTISTPSWFDRYVLSVSAVNAVGQPAVDDHGREISLSGPWIGVAAPGVFVQGLDDKGGLINATFNAQAGVLQSMNGTSFSAAFVSGLAALVRAKYPNLTAAQVIHRIEQTAHSPAALVDNRVGFGVIDPLAALDNDVPLGPQHPTEALTRPLELPPPPPPPDKRPMIVALAGSAIAVAVLVASFFVASLVKERRS